jgi:hypothetical protein
MSDCSICHQAGNPTIRISWRPKERKGKQQSTDRETDGHGSDYMNPRHDWYQQTAENMARMAGLILDNLERTQEGDQAIEQAKTSVYIYYEAQLALHKQGDATIECSKHANSQLHDTLQSQLKACQTKEDTARREAAKAVSMLDVRDRSEVGSRLQNWAGIPQDQVTQLMESLARVKLVENMEEVEDGDGQVNNSEHGVPGSRQSSWGTISSSGSVM